MIRPQRARSMRFAARFVTRNAPVRLASMTEVKSSSFIISRSVSALAPAALTSTSTGPSSSSTWVKAASTVSASVRSQRTGNRPGSSG
jgi:hypothetical protein